jgi:hypothetical protein
MLFLFSCGGGGGGDSIDSESTASTSSSTGSESTAGGATAVIEKTNDAISMPADGASSVALTYTLKDSTGNPVAQGTSATLTTNLGSFANGLQTCIAKTSDATGVITVSLMAGTQAGTATVTILSNGITQSKTVEITTVPTATPAFIKLNASPLSVKSDNSDSATVTATVLDVNYAVIEGVTVQFSASGGQISAVSDVTDANGEATVSFSSGTLDPSNQVVTVTGTVSALSSMAPVQVTGSTIDMDHTRLTISDDGTITDTLTITALDAASRPVDGIPVSISVTPGTGNATVSLSSDITDVNGKIAPIVVKGTAPGTVTVSASGLNASAIKVYTVTGAGLPVFGITSPTNDPQAMSTSDPPLSITVKAPGLANVRFATSLGTLSTSTAVPAETGQVVNEPVDPVTETATVAFSCPQAGLATIQVFDPNNLDTSDTIRIALTAPAVDAALITIQPSASVVAPSRTNVTNTITLKATVRTSSESGYQVVGNAPVVFSIENPTGGGEQISPVVVYTDSKGEAKTTFTSGQLSSITPVVAAAQVIGEGTTGPLTDVISFNDNNPLADTVTRSDGGDFTDPAGDGFERGETIRVKGSQNNDGTYIVDAVTPGVLTLRGGELTDELAVVGAGKTVTILSVAESTPITIGGTAGSVVIGAGTLLEAPDPTYYKLPMAVQVADHNGQGVSGAQVALNLWPAFYKTGGWYDENPKPAEIRYTTYISGTFPNEDVNQNLIEESWEDTNGDGDLTPPNSAGGSIPATVTTDENGVATFYLMYLKTNGIWITDRITASTVALGTEISSQMHVTLPVLESDVTSGDLPAATNLQSPYPLSFKIALGKTTSPYPLPIFRGDIDDDGVSDDSYAAAAGIMAGNNYTFYADPLLYTNPAVVQDTITIEGWVKDLDLGLLKIYRNEPVIINIE